VEAAFSAIEEATTLYLETIEALGERRRIFSEKSIEILPEPPEGLAVSLN
jgi:hypothetical protein